MGDDVTAIRREPDTVATEHFDLIVLGGGIQGALVTLESARRGLRPLLLEQNDFGGATSWNSLRIVHGGLRHLQHGDLANARRSSIEQTWWLRHFADLVEPLPCLLPIYNRGLRRIPFVRAALWIHRSLATPGDVFPQRSQILSPAETIARFQDVRAEGLQGGALWFDGLLREPQRVIVEILRWAVACGARALNYLECDDVIIDDGRVVGVAGHCRETERRFEFSADALINSAGSRATGAIGERMGARNDGSTLAYNLVLDRPPLSRCAVELSPGAQSYFCVPYKNRIMIGTVYLRAVNQTPTSVGERSIATFLGEVNTALPRLELSLADVVEVHAGLLPAAPASAQPARRPRIVDLSDHGGPRGLFSIDGVKFTDARLVAEWSLERLSRRHWHRPLSGVVGAKRPAPVPRPDFAEADLGSPSHAETLRRWCAEESVLHIDDLLLRRCDGDRDPGPLMRRAEAVMRSLPWDSDRKRREMQRLTDARKRLDPVSELHSEASS